MIERIRYDGTTIKARDYYIGMALLITIIIFVIIGTAIFLMIVTLR